MRKIAYIIITILILISSGYSLPDRQALYNQGKKAFQSGNYGSAELLFRKVIELNGDENKDNAWFHLALSIFHQKKYKAAIFEFNRFLLICTASDLCSHSRFWIAESYFRLKDYIKAIEEYKRYSAQSKNNSLKISALDRIADIYFIQGRYDESIIEWTTAIKNSTDENKMRYFYLKLGEAHFYNEEFEKALQTLEPLIYTLRDATVSARARLIIGRVYQLKKMHKKALKIFSGISRKLVKKAPFFDVQYYKAISHITLGDIQSARSYLESFILIGTTSDWYDNAKYELGKILIKLRNEKRGIELLEDVRKSTNKMELRSKSAMVLSRIFLKINPRDAIPYLEDSVSINDPTEQKNVLLLLSKVYIEVGRFDDAERILELLISKYPYDRDIDLVYFLLSRIYLQKGEVKNAIDGFNKISELNPFSRYIPESNYYRAVAYYKKDKINKAIGLIHKYLSMNKADRKFEAYSLLIKLYISKKEITKAESIIKIILKKYSKQKAITGIIYSFSQNSYLKQSSREKYFKLIMKQYPKSASASKIFLYWGDQAFVNKEYRKAEYFYRKYLQGASSQKKVSVFLYRAISLYYIEKYTEIIKLIEHDMPSNIDEYTKKQLTFLLGRCYYKIGNYTRVYKVFYPINLADFSNSDMLIFSKSAVEVGDINTAKKSNEVLRSRNKNLYAESLYYIGESYLKKKNIEKAKVAFLSISFECPDSEFADYAKLSMAKIYIEDKRYQEALQIVYAVKNEHLKEKKIVLRIYVLFKTKKYDEALQLTKKHRKTIIKSDYGELILKENIYYYFKKKDLKNFRMFTRYLKKYPGNEHFVNYYMGLFFFNNGKYSSAYYFLYKLAQVNCEYQDAALYYLGLISYFQHKNQKLAIKYFKKLANSRNTKNELVVKAKIFLSIIFKENGKIDQSRKYLTDIVNNINNKLLMIQAKNLFEYFGYSE